MKKIKFLFFVLFLFIGAQFSNAQYDIPEKPKFIPPVIDSIGLLNKVQYKKLYDKLVKYSDTTSTEVVVAIINSTKGEYIGVLAPRWAHKWEIGKKEEDNGILVLLAKNDRKIWIAPGYGIEHKLTAGVNGEIVRNVIIPEFKRDDYYSGLDKGLDAIFEVLNGEYKSSGRKSKKKGGDFAFLVFVIILVIFFILISRGDRGNGGRGNRRYSDARDIFETIILSNSGRGGGGFGGGFGSGGFGGSSSGGFGGFGGGGGFSGGGAGGSW